MKREWLMAGAAALVTVGLGMGCNKKTTSPVPQAAEPRAGLGDVTPPAEGSADLDMSDVTPMDPIAPAHSGGSMTGAGKIHVVQRGDTLFQLARQYYNDQSQWRRIYEANRSQIPNQNVLKVGQKLIIP